MAIRKKPISIKEYCALAGVTPPTISYRISNNDILPGVLYYEYDEDTRQYNLYRNDTIKDEDIKLYFRKKVATV